MLVGVGCFFIIMSDEPLVYIPLERWSELQNVFKVDWPQGICGYMVLDVQRYLIQNDLDYGFKLYCPFGDVCNGMVAVNIKDQLYEIIIQCPHEYTEKLEDALKRTKIVNWQRSIILPFTQYHVIECLRRVLGHQLKLYLLPVEKFIFDKPEIIDDIKLPPGMSFDLIRLEHLELVDATWPHRYPTSKWYFRLLIKAEFGYGLYEANKLISWVFYNESGELLHLHTAEDHRRKGYAELIVRLIRNVLIKKGKPTLAFCVTDNSNAFKLFNKLGFTKLEPVAWCYLNKGKE